MLKCCAICRACCAASHLRERVLATRAQVFVGVDAPDFNLALEEQLRVQGVPTVQFISPSIWAWRAERIKQIARAVDRMLLVFPFEQKIYDDAGIPATYVGHPLASMIPLVPDAIAARRRLGVEAEGTYVAVLPGSRPDEVRHIGPTFVAAMALIIEQQPSTRFLLPAADAALRIALERMIAERQSLSQHVSLIDGRSHDCLEAADVVLVASGPPRSKRRSSEADGDRIQDAALSAWIMVARVRFRSSDS